MVFWILFSYFYSLLEFAYCGIHMLQDYKFFEEKILAHVLFFFFLK